MLEEKTISLLLSESVEKIKRKKSAYPEWVRMADRAAIHAHIDTFPESLFKTKAPREDDAQWEYRRTNYRSNTRVHWNRAVNSTLRIYNKQNWSITFNPDKPQFEKESAKAYFTEDYPKFGSLVNWFQSVFHIEKFVDPNGVVLVCPEYIPEEDELVSPVAKIYPSDKVYHCSDDLVMVLTDHKSTVQYNGKPVKEGLVFYLATDEWIYKIEQVGKKIDYKFEIEEYFQHGVGEVPAFQLKGYPIKYGYKSYFYDALDALDEALYDYSTLQLGKVDRVFPIKVEVVDKCNVSGCESGRIFTGYTDDKDGNKVKQYAVCDGCGGTGYTGKSGPLVVNTITTDRYETDGQTPPFPNVAFVSPDVEPLRFLKEDIDGNLSNAFTSLNIPITIDKVDGTETATGRLIDREEFYSFLVHLAAENFGQLDLLMWWIGFMRYGVDYQGHTIHQPHEFTIRSSAELTEEMKAAKDAGFPDIVMGQLNAQYIKTRLTTDKHADRINEVVEHIDGLRHQDSQEISMAVAAGAIERWKWNLHLNIYAWILQKLDEDEKYLEKSISEIKTDMEAIAKTTRQLDEL
jgi:hypothetical protein